jgi:hypothetical protein
MWSWVHYQVNNDLMNDDVSSTTHMVKSRYVESKQFYCFLKQMGIEFHWTDQTNWDVILAIGIFLLLLIMSLSGWRWEHWAPI